MADDVRTFETGFERQEGKRPSRIDVIPAGPMRRWSTEAKARIISSSFEPGLAGDRCDYTGEPTPNRGARSQGQVQEDRKAAVAGTYPDISLKRAAASG